MRIRLLDTPFWFRGCWRSFNAFMIRVWYADGGMMDLSVGVWVQFFCADLFCITTNGETAKIEVDLCKPGMMMPSIQKKLSGLGTNFNVIA